MSKRVNPLSEIKLVYRPGKAPIKIALLAVIVLSTVTLIALHKERENTQAEAEAWKAQAAALEQENSDLEQNIDELGSEGSVIEIAQEELGLVDPDTVVFVPDN